MRNIVFLSSFFMLLLVAGCVDNKRGIDVSNSETEKLVSEVSALRMSAEDDASLSYELGKKLFELDLAKAKVRNVRSGNEPFLLEDKNNKQCVVLAHGFTASPWEVRELGEFLAEKNISVYGVLVAGHGTTREDLASTKWENWFTSFENAYSALSFMCGDVFVGGVSAGGSLALYLAENNRTKGVISLASMVYPRNENAKFAFLVKFFKPYFENGLDDSEKPYYYSFRPTAAVAELIDFMDVFKINLDKVKVPVLIMQYNNDSTVNPESACFIYNSIGSESKELVWFDGSDHVLTTGKDKLEVFDRVYNFIVENS